MSPEATVTSPLTYTLSAHVVLSDRDPDHAGVAVTLEDSPVPTALTARTSKVYSVPVLRLSSVWLVVVESLPAIGPQSGTQVVPPSMLCRCSYPVSGEPLSGARVQSSVTQSPPVDADRLPGASGTPAGVACRVNEATAAR